MKNPGVRIRELTLTVNAPLAQFEIVGLAVTAAHASRPRSPERPKEVSFEATPARPLNLERLAGEATLGRSLALRAVSFEGLETAFKNASVRFGTDITVRKALFGMAAQSIRVVPEVQPVKYSFTNVSFAANGYLGLSGAANTNNDVDFELRATASGHADSLSGTGKGRLGQFTGWSTSHAAKPRRIARSTYRSSTTLPRAAPSSSSTSTQWRVQWATANWGHWQCS